MALFVHFSDKMLRSAKLENGDRTSELEDCHTPQTRPSYTTLQVALSLLIIWLVLRTAFCDDHFSICIAFAGLHSTTCVQ
jgi:hypothetical protein